MIFLLNCALLSKCAFPLCSFFFFARVICKKISLVVKERETAKKKNMHFNNKYTGDLSEMQLLDENKNLIALV